MNHTYLKVKRSAKDRNLLVTSGIKQELDPNTDSVKDLLLFRQDLDGAVHAGQIRSDGTYYHRLTRCAALPHYHSWPTLIIACNYSDVMIARVITNHFMRPEQIIAGNYYTEILNGLSVLNYY